MLEKYGRALKKFRADHELTQRQMADDLNITQSALSYLENGRKPGLSVRKLEFIFDYIGFSHKHKELVALQMLGPEEKGADEETKKVTVEVRRGTERPKNVKQCIVHKTERTEQTEEDVLEMDTLEIERRREKELKRQPEKEIAKLKKQIAFYQSIFSKLSAGDESYRKGLIDAVQIFDEALAYQE